MSDPVSLPASAATGYHLTNYHATFGGEDSDSEALPRVDDVHDVAVGFRHAARQHAPILAYGPELLKLNKFLVLSLYETHPLLRLIKILKVFCLQIRR